MLYTTEGELVFENHAYRLICRTTEKTVNAAFARAGIDSECFADFSKVNNDLGLDVSVADNVKEMSAESVVVTIIAKAGDGITTFIRGSRISGSELHEGKRGAAQCSALHRKI